MPQRLEGAAGQLRKERNTARARQLLPPRHNKVLEERDVCREYDVTTRMMMRSSFNEHDSGARDKYSVQVASIVPDNASIVPPRWAKRNAPHAPACRFSIVNPSPALLSAATPTFNRYRLPSRLRFACSFASRSFFDGGVPSSLLALPTGVAYCLPAC